MVQIVGQLQSVVHQSLVRWLSISCHLVFWFPLTRLKQNCVSFSIIAQTKYRDIIKFQRWSKPLTNVAPKLFKTQNEVISKTCQSPVTMLSNGIGISQHRLNSASCVDFICFGSKFRQNYRLWHLAHRKTRKKQGPSTCRAPAKNHWSLARACFHFLPYGFCMSDWLVHGSDCWAVATYCPPWVTASHVFQFRVSDWLAHGSGWSWSIAKRCRPLVIGFGIPPANHLGGDPSPETYVLVLWPGRFPPHPKKYVGVWARGGAPPPGAIVLMGFNLVTSSYTF